MSSLKHCLEYIRQVLGFRFLILLRNFKLITEDKKIIIREINSFDLEYISCLDSTGIILVEVIFFYLRS